MQGKGTAQRMVCLVNSPPRWNERLNAYCLNFNGRVTCASVKNFQLVSENDLDRVVLQFGKVCCQKPGAQLVHMSHSADCN